MLFFEVSIIFSTNLLRNDNQQLLYQELRAGIVRS